MKTKTQEGHENKRGTSVSAPMGAIAQDYRASSDLGLHTGYVMSILSLFKATFVCRFKNLDFSSDRKNIQPKLYD